jgi:hypothetical protein
MKKELSESYKKRKNTILTNNKKYKQLNFKLPEEEYQAFKDKAKELELTDIDLFRMVMIVIKGIKKPKK